MSPLKDYHAVLGVKRDADAQEIKQAFKEMAFQFHPDRNPHNPRAEEKFKEIAEAYAFLSGNQELYYALQTPETASNQGDKTYYDIFDELFGIDFDQWTPPGKDIYQPVELTLEEAFLGRRKKFTVWRELICEACKGKGTATGEVPPTCSYCFGRGNIAISEHGVRFDKQCPKCRGLGRLPRKACPKCRARGLVPKKEKLEVELPPKLRQGQEIRYKGLGSLAARARAPGDLIVQVSIVPHSFFTFDGPHVLCEVSVTFLEAREGATVKVPTLQGAVSIPLAPGTRNGAVQRLPGLGLGGDQFIRIRVSEPEESFQQKLLPGSVEPGVSQSLWSKIKRFFRT
ncbi:MAG: J domain-containing protein [bacterium]